MYVNVEKNIEEYVLLNNKNCHKTHAVQIALRHPATVRCALSIDIPSAAAKLYQKLAFRNVCNTRMTWKVTCLLEIAEFGIPFVLPDRGLYTACPEENCATIFWALTLPVDFPNLVTGGLTSKFPVRNNQSNK